MSERQTTTCIRATTRFSEQQIVEMFSLHTRYFANATLEKFRSDFSAKHWCILIVNHLQSIVGYSTIQLIERTIQSVPHLIVFSGDTLVAQEYRNANTLLPAFVHFSDYLALHYPSHQRYLLLITKGYRTYRLLPVHYRSFFPSYRGPTPGAIKELQDLVCREKFGLRYDAAAGIVRADKHSDFLQPHHATIPPGRLQNRDVQFFLDANQHYRLGDELVCLASLDLNNLYASCRRRYFAGQRSLIES